MKLFKNVEIKDLENILVQGIISIEDGASNHWDDNQRAKNSESVVYLFDSKCETNSFVQYGAVLIEVDVDDVVKNELTQNDFNGDKYNEYICKSVNPEQIVSVSIPRLVQEQASQYLSEKTMNMVNWVELEATTWDNGIRQLTSEELLQWSKTVQISVEDYNYFRGTYQNNTMIDLYDVRYI